jgi:hypothetical protein
MPRLLSKVQYIVQKRLLLDPTLSHINPVHIPTTCFCKINFNIIFPSLILYLSILLHSISYTLTLPFNATFYFSHIYSLAQHVSALISHHQVRSTAPKLLDCFDIIATIHYSFLRLNSQTATQKDK